MEIHRVDWKKYVWDGPDTIIVYDGRLTHFEPLPFMYIPKGVRAVEWSQGGGGTTVGSRPLALLPQDKREMSFTRGIECKKVRK